MANFSFPPLELCEVSGALEVLRKTFGPRMRHCVPCVWFGVHGLRLFTLFKMVKVKFSLGPVGE
jgi:hypothetical protein